VKQRYFGVREILIGTIMTNFLLFAATVLIWGSTWFGIKLQLGVVPIEWSLVYRFAFAAALMFAFSLLTKRPIRYDFAAHKLFLGLGFLLFGLNYYLSYLGTTYMTSGLVAVVFSSLTLMNIFNAAIFLKRPFEPQVLGAALFGLLGIGLIFWPEIQITSLGTNLVRGIVILFTAAFVASLGNTLAATKKAKAIPLVATNSWGMFYGTVLLLGFALFSGQELIFDPSMSYALSLIYLTVFGTIIAFTCLFMLINRIGPERAGYFAVMFPVVALTISTFLEGYQWSLMSVSGLIMALGGNYLILRSREKNSPHIEPVATGE
jgi:drug/metabolite transporter (DMT)-like permease